MVSYQTNIEFRPPLDRINPTLCDIDYSEKELTSVLNCRRLLLNAGADPMPHGYPGNLLINAITSDKAVRILS